MKNTKIILITFAFLVILITLSITNFINYKENISYKNSLQQSNKIANEYKSKFDKLVDMQTENIQDKNQDKMILINEASTNFLNAFFTYDALSKNKIYDNIKPYSTQYLITKLKPVKEDELASDVNFKVSISNIRIYTKSISDDEDISVLAMADEGIDTNKSSSKSPILVELSLKKLNNNWLVDNIQITTSLTNQHLIN
jgi:hypothetical protein